MSNSDVYPEHVKNSWNSIIRQWTKSKSDQNIWTKDSLSKIYECSVLSVINNYKLRPQIAHHWLEWLKLC